MKSTDEGSAPTDFTGGIQGLLVLGEALSRTGQKTTEGEVTRGVMLLVITQEFGQSSSKRFLFQHFISLAILEV